MFVVTVTNGRYLPGLLIRCIEPLRLNMSHAIIISFRFSVFSDSVKSFFVYKFNPHLFKPVCIAVLFTNVLFFCCDCQMLI